MPKTLIMPKTLGTLLANESGVTMIEYGLLALLVAVAALTVLTSVGESVQAVFTEVASIF